LDPELKTLSVENTGQNTRKNISKWKLLEAERTYGQKIRALALIKPCFRGICCRSAAVSGPMH